jgi:hypothetical protein
MVSALETITTTFNVCFRMQLAPLHLGLGPPVPAVYVRFSTVGLHLTFYTFRSPSSLITHMMTSSACSTPKQHPPLHSRCV